MVKSDVSKLPENCANAPFTYKIVSNLLEVSTTIANYVHQFEGNVSSLKSIVPSPSELWKKILNCKDSKTKLRYFCVFLSTLCNIGSVVISVSLGFIHSFMIKPAPNVKDSFPPIKIP